MSSGAWSNPPTSQISKKTNLCYQPWKPKRNFSAGDHTLQVPQWVEVVLQQLCIPCCNLFDQSGGLCNQKWIMHACMYILIYVFPYLLINRYPWLLSIYVLITRSHCIFLSILQYFPTHLNIPLSVLALFMFEILQCFFLSCTVCNNYWVVETHDRRQVWNWKV